MKLERYTVRAKRVDTGEAVEGFLIEHDTDVCIWHKIGNEYHITDIDTETVEPLAMAIEKTGREYNCPNCGRIFFALQVIDGKPIHGGYCDFCGQRLDLERPKRGYA